MVVECPKCKTRLKIADEKIAPDGTKFKCPKCAMLLLVRPSRKPQTPVQPSVAPSPQPSSGPAVQRPVATPAPKPEVQPTPKPEPVKAQRLAGAKIALVAHAENKIIERIVAVMKGLGYETISSSDGVDTMVKAMRELPNIIIVDVALPKILGFEVCKRLREKEETKNIKLILISSIYDKTRYRREPVSLYGADDYIEEHEIESLLPTKVIELVEGKKAEAPEPALKLVETPAQSPPMPAKASKPIPAPAVAASDELEVKARRLVRTILSDIYLYSAQKVEESVRTNSFLEAFAAELKEGMKLYEARVPADVRTRVDYFNEEINKFLATRKKSMGL